MDIPFLLMHVRMMYPTAHGETARRMPDINIVKVRFWYSESSARTPYIQSDDVVDITIYSHTGFSTSTNPDEQIFRNLQDPKLLDFSLREYLVLVAHRF